MKSNKLRSPVFIFFFFLAVLLAFLLLGYKAYGETVDFLKAKQFALDPLLDFLKASGIGLWLTLGGILFLICFFTGVFAKSRPVILLSSLFCLLVFLASGVVLLFGTNFDTYNTTLLSLDYWKSAFTSGFAGLSVPCLLIGYVLTFLFAFLMVCLRYEKSRSAFSVVIGILAFVFGLAGTALSLPYKQLIDNPETLKELDVIFNLLAYFAPALMGIATLGLACYRPKQIPVELAAEPKVVRI